LTKVELTEKELKLIRLALNSAAQPGETKNAGAALAASLRARGISAQELESLVSRKGNNGGWFTPQKPTTVNWGNCKMPFGKHKEERFKEIDPSYLDWVHDWLVEDDERASRFSRLIEQLEKFLEIEEY